VARSRWFAVARNGIAKTLPRPPSAKISINALIGHYRNSSQNPDDKELRGQNLDNKRLKRRRLALEQTVTASTMIADLNLRGKVRCHDEAVENVRFGVLAEFSFPTRRRESGAAEF
jgi:hypothetical protein